MEAATWAVRPAGALGRIPLADAETLIRRMKQAAALELLRDLGLESREAAVH